MKAPRWYVCWRSGGHSWAYRVDGHDHGSFWITPAEYRLLIQMKVPPTPPHLSGQIGYFGGFSIFGPLCEFCGKSGRAADTERRLATSGICRRVPPPPEGSREEQRRRD